MTRGEKHDHHAVLELLERESPSAEMICDLADLFKIFGDTTRMRILYALLESEMCVCAIAEYLGMTQSAISHQLALLKRARLVRPRRDGRTVFYSLADSHVRIMLDQGMEHVNE